MTRERSYRLFLRDIIDACDDCTEFVEGFEFPEFLHDRKTRQAVSRLIGIIGEAANQIPESIRLQAPEIRWGTVIGMRNRLIHEYFAVDYGVVWNTIQEDLPPLRDRISQLLEETPG